MNNWSFTGNIGKDCTVEQTQNGTSVCKFSVAVKSGFGDNESTTWVNCRLWGKRAESKLPQYLLQGQKVAIVGEASLAEWQGQDGSQNKALMVNVSGVDLAGEVKAQSNHQPAPQPQQQRAPQPQQPPQGMDAFDDDIPF
jgi:single-strand DNA-binding protein